MASELQLEHISIFEGASAPLPPEIADRLVHRTLEPGEYLFRQGDAGESVCLIEKGLVEIWLDGPLGKTLSRRVRSNEVLGEMSLLTGEPRSASAVAVVRTSIAELDRQACA